MHFSMSAFQISAFQLFSFYFKTLPPLVDFPSISGKNLRVDVGCGLAAPASGAARAIKKRMGV
jgi:hypothetical protein